MASTFSDEITYAQNERVKANKERLRAGASLGALGVASAGVLALAGFEVSIAYTLMQEVYSTGIPGEETPSNVLLMSGATVVGIVGYEVLQAHKPDSKLLKLIERAAYIAVPVFFFGMVVLLGTSEIVSTEATGPIAFDGENPFQATTEQGFDFERLVDAFTPFALASLMIINLVVISKLVTLIRSRFPDAFKSFVRSNAIVRQAKSVLALAERRIAIENNTKRRDTQVVRKLPALAAGEIEIAAGKALRTMSKIDARAENSKGSDNPLMKQRDAKRPKPLPDANHQADFQKKLEAQLKALPDQFRKALK